MILNLTCFFLLRFYIHNQQVPGFPVGFAGTPVIKSQQCLPNLNCKPMGQALGLIIHSVANLGQNTMLGSCLLLSGPC